MTTKANALIAEEHRATIELLDVARELDAVLLSSYGPDTEKVPHLMHALTGACKKLLAAQERVDLAYASRHCAAPKAIQ